MKKSTAIVSGLILLALVAGGFYFRGDIIKIFERFNRNIKSIASSDFGNVVSEISKEIINPPPLNIGGSANNVVLTKGAIITQTNLQRHDNGNLPALVENTKLDAAALAKAQDMFKQQYFEHISPSGVDPGTLVKTYGYEYVVTGENLILGNFTSEQEVVQLWMNSPGHRANILNNRYVDIGVAIVKGTYKGETAWIGVQEFGLPLSACPEASIDLKNQIEANKATLDNLSVQIEAKRREIDGLNPGSKEYNASVDEYNQLVDQYNALNQQTKNSVTQYNSQINAFNQCVAGAK